VGRLRVSNRGPPDAKADRRDYSSTFPKAGRRSRMAVAGNQGNSAAPSPRSRKFCIVNFRAASAVSNKARATQEIRAQRFRKTSHRHQEAAANPISCRAQSRRHWKETGSAPSPSEEGIEIRQEPFDRKRHGFTRGGGGLTASWPNIRAAPRNTTILNVCCCCHHPPKPGFGPANRPPDEMTGSQRNDPVSYSGNPRGPITTSGRRLPDTRFPRVMVFYDGLMYQKTPAGGRSLSKLVDSARVLVWARCRAGSR